MDTKRFDDLIRSLSLASSRRGVLATLASGLLALLPAVLIGEDAEAKKKRRKGKKKRKTCKPRCAAVRPCGDNGCRRSCGSCRDGQTCLDGTCVCSGDEDCGAEETCQSGACLCGANPGCAEFQRCENGACVTGIGSCEAGKSICLQNGDFNCAGAAEGIDPNCACFVSVDSGTRCGSTTFPGMGCLAASCASDAECQTRHPAIAGAFCSGGGCCVDGGRNLCVAPCPEA